MTNRAPHAAAIFSMLILPIIGGCASSAAKDKARADRVAAAQRSLDATVQKLNLTPAQQSKLATVYKWQSQQSASNAHLAVGDERLFLDNGQFSQRLATVEDVDRSVLGKGMPTDPNGIQSIVDVHVRSILSSEQYAMYRNDLSPEERAALADQLRNGMRSTAGQR